MKTKRVKIMNHMRIRVTYQTNEAEVTGRVIRARRIRLILKNLGTDRIVEGIHMRRYPGEMRSLKMTEKMRGGGHVGEKQKSVAMSPQITWLTSRLE